MWGCPQGTHFCSAALDQFVCVCVCVCQFSALQMIT